MLGIDHPVRPDSHEAGITEPVAQFIKPMIVDIRPGQCSANVYFYQQSTGQINFCLTQTPRFGAIIARKPANSSHWFPGA